jgi:hypothetical protein
LDWIGDGQGRFSLEKLIYKELKEGLLPWCELAKGPIFSNPPEVETIKTTPISANL